MQYEVSRFSRTIAGSPKRRPAPFWKAP